MSDPCLWAVIPAAGVGRRMGADIPKQYLPLAGRKVIDHAVERLLLHPAIDGLYIALAADDHYWFDTEFAGHPDVVRVAGGQQRADSVLAALTKLQDRADDHDWVLVHDGARPCVRRSDVSKLIDATRRHAVGGLLGMPVRDTMKRDNTLGRVSTTVERNGLWHALTPQMFRLDLLIDALQQADRQGLAVTDDASAMELAGYQPRLVEAHEDNIKITRKFDLQLAHLYLQHQKES